MTKALMVFEFGVSVTATLTPLGKCSPKGTSAIDIKALIGYGHIVLRNKRLLGLGPHRWILWNGTQSIVSLAVRRRYVTSALTV